MRSGSTSLAAAALAAVAAVGCGSGKGKTASGAGAGDGGAAGDAGAIADAEVADAGAVPVLEELPAGVRVPGGLKIGSRVVDGARFVDAEGEGFIYLVERASRDRSSVLLYAVYERGSGADARRLREVDDVAERCPPPSPTGFVKGSLAVTDLDHDGAAEVWFAWVVGCGTDEEPLVAKQFVLEGKHRYVIRGEGPFDGQPDPAAATWPAGWFEPASASFETIAASLAPSPTAAHVLSRDDFTEIVVDREGDVPMNVTYPDLAPLPDALNAELTARMKKFLRTADKPAPDEVGIHEGDCFVGLVAPELVSISCRRLIDSRTTRVVFTYWRERALPAIDPAELVGADRLKALCGDAVRPRFILDRDGLRWVGDDDHPAPDDCVEGIEWADMAPASPRAKALVTRQLAPVE
jgi:hypothetical protein